MSDDAMDDVVQEVFIVVHAKLHTVHHSDVLRSWIYSIVRRTVSSHQRTRRVQQGTGVRWMNDGAVEGQHHRTPENLAEHAADLKLLTSWLNKLDEAKREVFALVELEEMSVPEVADMLGIPLNTAYSRLRAARQDLEDALARHNLISERQTH